MRGDWICTLALLLGLSAAACSRTPGALPPGATDARDPAGEAGVSGTMPPADSEELPPDPTTSDDPGVPPPPTAPPPSEPAPALEPGIQDRCLGGPCGAVTLPEQPEVPFLGPAEDGWLRLIEARWQLAPNSEGYRCARLTVPEDVYITAFRPVSPTGTHHTVLVVNGNPDEPDGVTACGVLASGERRLQGAGAGSEPSTLPDGVAMKIAAGEQLLMNLHLFNPSSAPLTGTSGTWVRSAPSSEVEHEAGVILAGPLSLTIPPGEVTQTGGCTLSNPATLFSVGPHMHQLGVHMRVTARSSIVGDQVLYDDAYEFGHQLVYRVDEIPMGAGDRVSLECTYQNDTDRTVHWGDSTLDEMCFVGLGVYPVSGDTSFPCVN